MAVIVQGAFGYKEEATWLKLACTRRQKVGQA